MKKQLYILLQREVAAGRNRPYPMPNQKIGKAELKEMIVSMDPDVRDAHPAGTIFVTDSLLDQGMYYTINGTINVYNGKDTPAEINTAVDSYLAKNPIKTEEE